jgi:hypothetical protein
MMACTVADHLLPLEIFLFAMLMEESGRDGTVINNIVGIW